jgi:nondiscriminating glutamyl-tRNA synthetase
MSDLPLKTRFAPSPTGLLHLGNIRTALFNYLLASGRGTFLLRVEDTDAARSQDRYIDALKQDLAWLGLVWTEGPDRDGRHGPYLQSQRAEIYAEFVEQLKAKGLAYPCFCTEHELKVERKTQLAAGRPPRYSGKCRNLKPHEVEDRRLRGVPATLRFHVRDGETVEFDDKVRGLQRFNTSDIGDFVILRSDGTPQFFFGNAVDDSLMGVTLVVRGDDHLTNTPRQLLLLQALGLRAPDYAHLPMVVGHDGAPLSKRTGSKSTQELRDAGYLPLAICNYLARVGHTYDENRLLSLAELSEHFSIERVHHSPARYDEAQLLYWQREAVRAASTADLIQWMGEQASALAPPALHEAFIEAVRPNLTFPSDALHWAKVVFSDELPLSSTANEAIRDAGAEFFKASLSAVGAHHTDFKALSSALGKQTGRTGKGLYKPLRAALTGELDGPEMARLLPLIGVDRVRTRFERALERNG